MTSIKHRNNLCLVTLPSPSSSAELDKLLSKLAALEKVKKLCGFLTNPNNQQNDPTNILNNLCSGLETFLGFNKDSKGYDGSGIVYSDLDRLCDGVMGFLSGVLSAVKDDDAVKTYDKHLEKPLEKVLDEVNKNIGPGRDGLVESVDAVKGWLEGYELEYSKKASNVTEFLGELKTKIAGTYTNNVSCNAENKLETQLTKWNETLQHIEKNVETLQTNYIDALNSTLKNMISSEMSCINSGVVLLKNSVNDTSLRQLVSVDETLERQRQRVIGMIEDEAANLQIKLKNEIERMFHETDRLGGCKREQFKHIRNAIAFCRSSLHNFDSEYKDVTSHHFDAIKHALTDIDPKDKSEFPKGKSQLRKDAENIATQLRAVGEKLQDNVNAIEKWKTETKSFIDGAKQKYVAKLIDKVEGLQNTGLIRNKAAELKEWKNKLEGYINDDIRPALRRLTTEATKQIEELERVYKENLAEIRDDVLAKVGDEKRGALQKLIVLDAEIKKDLRKLRDRIKKEVIEGYFSNQLPGQVEKVLNELVKPIYEERKAGSLGDIVKQVREYASSFDERFKAFVSAIVKTIVDSEGIQKGYLNWYVGDSSSEINRDVATVSQQIQTTLNELLGKQIEKVGNSDRDNIDTVLTKISTCLTSFAGKLDNQIPELNPDTIAKTIHDALNGKITTRKAETYISRTVKIALGAVKSATTEAGKEILNFEKNSKIAQLATSIQSLQSLGGSARKGLEQSADSVLIDGKNFFNTAVSGIDAALKQVIAGDGDTNLEGIQFREGPDNKGLMPDYLKQTKIGALPGTLRHTIEQIKQKVETEIHVNKGANSRNITIRGVEPASRTNLDETISRIETISTDLTVKLTTDALESLSTQISNNLSKLMSSFAVTGRHINAYFNTLQTEKIDVELNRIQNIFDGLHTDEFSTTAGTIQQAIDKVTNLIQYLELVPNDIDSRKNEARSLLEALKGSIEKHIAHIEQSVNTADREVGNAIIDLEDVVRSVYKEMETSIKRVEQTLLSTTRNAFTIVTAEVRKMLSEQKIADLKALRTLVGRRLKKIKTIIDEDSRTGIKGLLKTINGIKVSVKPPGTPTFEGTDTLLVAINDLATMKPPTAQNFTQLSTEFYAYYDNVNTYIKYQVTDKSKSLPNQLPTDQTTDPAKQLTKIKDDFDNLLTHLQKDGKKYNYDNDFVKLLSLLSTSLAALSPSHFANPRHPELLDAVKKGLRGFVGEMERVYVNGYDGHREKVDMGKLVVSTLNSDAKSGTNDELTDDGRMLSKVFLTLLEILCSSFLELQKTCATNKKERIRLYNASGNGKLVNALGAFLHKLGYKVPTEEDKQDGELQNKDKTMTGNNILDLCLKTVKGQKFGLLATNGPGILGALYEYLKMYYEVCHLEVRPSTKYPANSYQMLQWLAGLRWSPLFRPLGIYMKQLFPKPHKDDPRDIAVIPSKDIKLQAFPTTGITPQKLYEELNHVCLFSHSVLTVILGHGHSDGRYAVDFCTNAENLLYPARDSDCFDMFVNILDRVYHQFRFLYSRCESGPENGGWADCWYGRDVGGSDWRCNNKQCANQTCPQRADQIAKQTDDQTAEQICDQHPKCGVKSPLQSFLEDGLQGFLPHQFKKPGCKLDCTTANHRGIPCKTPMGFANISHLASHTMKGEHLRDILRDFCAKRSHLRTLCSYLACLLQRPPQTLGDMFAFYYNFVSGWGMEGNEHKMDAFKNAINDANFGAEYDKVEIHTVFSSSHTATSTGHADCSLGCLVCISKDPAICGPYLYPISQQISGVFSKNYADKYMSWIVYITETFYDLLKKLYDECNANCGSKGSNCFTKCCVKGCPTTSTKTSEPATHTVECKSIVACKSTLPTLYRYGFVFWYPDTLNGNAMKDTKRTCKAFCEALDTVLNTKKSDSPILAKLIYETIPNFLWNIREKFFWLTVALWSLSLLYLICVMVGRLDVLHIRSHLRSPSSHKITAHSLLAAAQVGRLAKISYLQP